MKKPCKFDHNGECLICDCQVSECAYDRYLNKDYKYESQEELSEMFDPKYKVGDKLIADDYTRKVYGINVVEITDINLKNRVYHWEAKEPYFGGIVHSGYFFEENLKLYTE